MRGSLGSGFVSAFANPKLVNHLLLFQHREPTAIVLITLYFFLFFLFEAAYLRVLWTIYANPGFVPKGDDASEIMAKEKIVDGNYSDPEMGLGSVRREDESLNFANAGTPHPGTPRPGTASSNNEFLGPRDIPPREGTAGNSTSQSQDPDLALPSPVSQRHLSHRISETPSSNALLPPIIHQDRPLTTSTVQGHAYDSYGYRLGPVTDRPEPENLSEWYNRDVYVCEPDGKPRWCWHCNCYKPDRSHHCSEVQRCVYKMDHFCPW